jgi:hypothetical protein
MALLCYTKISVVWELPFVCNGMNLVLRQPRVCRHAGTISSALGQVLMFSRGHGADESRAAFIRALDIVEAIDNPTERFTVCYGLWIGHLVRGALRFAREIAETFLREALRRARAMECVVANPRVVGHAKLPVFNVADHSESNGFFPFELTRWLPRMQDFQSLRR